MQPLGLDPLACPVEMTTGVGSPSNPTHFNNITLDFGSFTIPAYSGFMTAMDQLGFGLLGQMGFFEAFKSICFDYNNKLFHLDL